MEQIDPPADEFHTPVLVEQVLSYLAPAPGQTVLDATEGGAGHSSRIAALISPGGRLIGLDRDPDAIRVAEKRLTDYRASVDIILRNTTFSDIDSVLRDIGGGQPVSLQGCVFDLGISSHQVDHAPGFSFRRDEFLDGRFNREGDEPTVAQIIADSTEQELSRILWEYGEEKFARRIARRITEFKAGGAKLESTGELVRMVEAAMPRSQWPRNIHPATRVFQALRIRANNELDELRTGLNAACDNLAIGGRIAVISFHSLEDRIVKSMFADRAGMKPSASSYSPAAHVQASSKPDLRLLTRKPVMADSFETSVNVRSRSAKLRAAERIA